MFAEPVTRPGVSPRILPEMCREAEWRAGEGLAEQAAEGDVARLMSRCRLSKLGAGIQEL